MSQRFATTAIAAGLWGSGVLFASMATAQAQSVAEFYKRNALSLYVGSGVGGGFDSYARVFAPHFARHVPGTPSIVIKNMPGAAGLTSMNFIAASAPRDGSALLASFNTVIFESLYGRANAKFEPRRLGWIGSIGKQTATCLTWSATPIKTIEDARTHEVLVGATGDGSTPVMYPNLLNGMLGTRFKVIIGYTTSGMRLAVERGEVQGICGVAWETHMASVPHWIIDNKVNFLLQLGLRETPHLRGVPLALDLIPDPDDRRVFELLAIPQEFGRPIVAPPDVPEDRLKALQAAFNETMKDKDYLADADRAHQFVDPLSADEILSLLARAYAAPEAIRTRAAVYAGASTN
jgi:tripartite-type tricarboxylate transporter receptor subunit TctC